MPLRIACDLDGTLADMESALQREAEALFGPDVDLRASPGPRLPPLQPPANSGGTATAADTASPEGDRPPIDKRPLSERERRTLWARVSETEGFWSSLAEIEPGSVARLATLAEVHRWEILFITQRPGGAGPTPQRQTQQWLRAHGFELPSVFVMQGSRGRLAEALALDAVVDDRPDNCLDVVTDSSARAILVWRDDPAGVPAGAMRLGITITYSFSHALGHLETMMASRHKAGGLLGRIRGAIGM